MKNRINSNFDNVVSKLNVFGGVLMIYYAFRPPLDKGFFLHDTTLQIEIVFAFGMLYFISGFILVFKRIRIEPKKHFDVAFAGLGVILISESINLFA